MAAAVEASDLPNTEVKVTDNTDAAPKLDTTTKDEAPTEVTNGEGTKESSEHEKKDKFASFRDRDDRDSHKGRRKDNDRGRNNHRGRDNHRGGKFNNRGRGGGGGGGRGKSFDNQRKTRFEHLKESSDADEIRRQVEFYFSDSNLPTDAFLLEKTGGNQNLPVDLKLIHTFSRMRHFQPYSAVRDAVKASDFLELDDKDSITRKVPLDEKFTDDPIKNRTLLHTDSMPRSIYAKGFGDELDESQTLIEEFFMPYGEIKSVRLRRQNNGAFKGSVFVEFADEKTAQDFLAVDPKPEFNGKELQIMSKQAYVETKHQGILDGTVKPKSPTRDGYRGRGRGRGRGGYDRRDDRDRRAKHDRDDRDNWKDRRAKDQAKDKKRGGSEDSDEGRLKRGRSEEEYSDDEGEGKRRRYSDERIEEETKVTGSTSPDEKKRKRSDDDGEEDVPTRAEAEAKRAKLESEASAGAGAETEKTEGGAEVKDEAAKA